MSQRTLTHGKITEQTAAKIGAAKAMAPPTRPKSKPKKPRLRTSPVPKSEQEQHDFFWDIKASVILIKIEKQYGQKLVIVYIF